MQNTTLVRRRGERAAHGGGARRQLARAAGAASLSPHHARAATSFDGDVVFAVSPTQRCRRAAVEPMIIEALAVVGARARDRAGGSVAHGT